MAGSTAHALHLLGDIAADPDRFESEKYEANDRQSPALAEARGMRPLIAHCHLELCKLYRRTGKPEQAREYLSSATATAKPSPACQKPRVTFSGVARHNRA